MPKYYEFKIAGYYLYFTSYCIIECMHVHASDRKLTEAGSAKFFVKNNGDTILQNRGVLNDREVRKIQAFIKQNYREMYLKWSAYSQEGFYGDKCDRTISAPPACVQAQREGRFFARFYGAAACGSFPPPYPKRKVPAIA